MKEVWKKHRIFCILSGAFIVLVLLLGDSLNSAYAQEPVVELSGWFSTIWGDSKDGRSSITYTLTGENGQRTLLLLDETAVKELGGVLSAYSA
ncbi:hypothetical protein JY97_16670 [Alkalispirochaeta odontotermitis]|nr:hypothetical protein JY97_16670 [Alkalispirochaeta odontotermitis]CAB1079686.1 hypothetical protein D1AOALGA4SA_7394 [Olavius algarvensis Delta 1 endosymbiont]